MKLLRHVSADEMIGEFLQAELYSSRFRAGNLKALRMLGYEPELLEKLDYDNAWHNKQRAHVLRLTRGWPDEWLFRDFPADTRWSRVSLARAGLHTVFRLKSRSEMTDKERRVSRTTQLVARNQHVTNIDNTLVRTIAAHIANGEPMPPIILACQSTNGKKVLLEGHSRSVAYCIAKYQGGIPAILGRSSRMADWVYFEMGSN